jgi:hypothetical protein
MWAAPMSGDLPPALHQGVTGAHHDRVEAGATAGRRANR